MVATATVVAGIKQNGEPATAEFETIQEEKENPRLSSSLNITSTRTKCCNDSLNPGTHCSTVLRDNQRGQIF